MYITPRGQGEKKEDNKLRMLKKWALEQTLLDLSKYRVTYVSLAKWISIFFYHIHSSLSQVAYSYIYFLSLVLVDHVNELKAFL